MLKFTILPLFILLFISTLYAAIVEYTLDTGISYDSNVQYLSLYDKLKDNNNKEGAFFFNNDFNGEFFFPGYGFLMTVGCFTMFSPTLIDASKADFSFSLSKQIPFSDSWKSEIRFDNSLLGENHSSLFFSSFKSIISATAVYEFNEYIDIYTSLSGGFITGIDSIYEYITGPVAAIEGGVFVYSDMEDDFIRITAGNTLYIGRDEKIYLADDNMIYVNNRFTRLYLLIGGELCFNSLIAGFSVKTEYSLWFYEDLQNYVLWKKRRTEEMFSVAAYLRYHFTKTMAAELFASCENVFSNFGKDNKDYVDYNYFRVISSFKFIIYI